MQLLIMSAIIALSTHSKRTTGWGGVSRCGKLQSGGTESIWSDEALLHIIKGKINCSYSWSTNHLQLVSYAQSLMSDSIQASTRQYTIIGYVRNRYYPLMKCSIRILRERRGWLLSSQKAVWLLTICYFWWLSLDFNLDRGQRSEYRIYWSVTPLEFYYTSRVKSIHFYKRAGLYSRYQTRKHWY